MKMLIRLLPILAFMSLAGCVSVKTEPIHITVDINIRIQKELDSFFDDIDEQSEILEETPTDEN